MISVSDMLTFMFVLIIHGSFQHCGLECIKAESVRNIIYIIPVWRAKHRALGQPRASFITQFSSVWPQNKSCGPPLSHPPCCVMVWDCTTDLLHAPIYILLGLGSKCYTVIHCCRVCHAYVNKIVNAYVM